MFGNYLLHGDACARCPRTKGLRLGGVAHVASGFGGEARLGSSVSVRPDPAGSGSAW